MGSSPDGYCLVKLYLSVRKHRIRKVHQLVLEAFVGTCPVGLEVRHLDDNKSNNRLTNLCYGTRSQNQLDRHGRGSLKGERHHQAKLSAKDVCLIRADSMVGVGTRKLAAKHGVSKHTIQRIVARRSWKHIA